MIIAKKQTRQWGPIIVFLVIIGFLLSLPQWYSTIDDNTEVWSNIWLGVIGGAATIYLGLIKQWMDHDKMFKELFLEFNQRFNDLNEDLNEIVEKTELPSIKTKQDVVEKEKLSSDKTKEAVIQDYINLCAEEYLWYKTDELTMKFGRPGKKASSIITEIQLTSRLFSTGKKPKAVLTMAY